MPALANDTSAELSTGGLIFVRNDDVEMLSEDLAISAREVSVRYRFLNRSDKDVTVLVAFPMPDIQVVGPDDITSVPTDDMRRVRCTTQRCKVDVPGNLPARVDRNGGRRLVAHEYRLERV